MCCLKECQELPISTSCVRHYLVAHDFGTPSSSVPIHYHNLYVGEGETVRRNDITTGVLRYDPLSSALIELAHPRLHFIKRTRFLTHTHTHTYTHTCTYTHFLLLPPALRCICRELLMSWLNMPPSLESSLALNDPSTIKRKQLVLDVPLIRKSPIKSIGKWPKPRMYGDEPLPVKPSDVNPRNGRIVGRVAEFGQIPVYTLAVGDTEINGIKLWEILDYVSPLELERFENQQFKEEAEALEIARAAAEIEKERKRLKQAEKAKQKGTFLFPGVGGDEDESSDEDDVPQGRRGRARPTYTHLFNRPELPDERRRRRKRDPETGELMPLSDEDLPRPSDRGPKRRRRRKRDPLTGELMPLSDHGEDIEMRASEEDATTPAARSPAPEAMQLPKRRRRRRDPKTGELLPLDATKSMEKDSRYKRPRRRRHPITHELMPLGWRYDPDEEKKASPSARDLVSPAMRKMSISREHGSKRIKLASESSDDRSQGRPLPSSSVRMPLRGTPAKSRPIPSAAKVPIDTSESDDLARDSENHHPISASKPQATPKTSILHPTKAETSADDSSDSSAEPITLASFLKASGRRTHSDDESEDSEQVAKPNRGQVKTSIMNPMAPSQAAEVESDEEELEDDEWIVEAIVGHRMSDPNSHPGRKQVVLYHTKWEGSEEMTWEPAESFLDSSTVRDYHKRLEEEKRNAQSANGKVERSKQPLGVAQRETTRVPVPSIAQSKKPVDSSEEETGEDDEEGWEIESILAHHMSDPRTHPGKPQTMLYKVKWAGWKEHTWEPLASFPDKSVVNAYRRKVGLIPVKLGANSNLQSSEATVQMEQLNPTTSTHDNTTAHYFGASEAAQTTVGDGNVTTCESLPAELGNRIYHLSGCLQFYEEPDRNRRSSARHPVRGDYTADTHTAVHGCGDGEHCSFTGWDGFCNWQAAAYFVNGDPEFDTANCGPRTCAENIPWFMIRVIPSRKSLICYQMKGAQPGLTRVSKKVREDTLPIFYGNHRFVVRLFSADAPDENRVLRWLDAIRQAAANMLRKIYIFYARKQQLNHIKNNVLPELRARGVKTAPGELGVVCLTRISHPYNTNAFFVLEATSKLRDAQSDGAE
ncbi:hypothetical protein AC578_9458 [Pseudocercospora eumusae]|uniref:Chromo domain-containing protein n=1 Tax=Pseudocercospora eumusae TaxID=321146 RepID=A0A139GYL0_9PEZI|nr:hypothetical protein AC578_9458 [Pseudocercospora eumusae]